jgi:hypothetical protein
MIIKQMSASGVLARSHLFFPLNYLLSYKVGLFFGIVFFIKIILYNSSIQLGKVKILFNHYTLFIHNG